MLRCAIFGTVVGALACGAWGQCGWSEVFEPAYMSGGTYASAALFDDGTGVRLVVSDLERRGDAEGGLQVWDGSAWSTLSDGQFDLSDVAIVGADNEGSSARLFAVLGGSGDITEVAVLENGAWSATSFPVENGLQVAAGFAPDPLTGDVYMFGLFRNDGEWTKVYKWDGAAWTALDQDTSGASVTSLAWFNDGSGLAMYAGVRTRIDGVPVQGLAKWDGASWSEVPGCPVFWPTIATHDDGSGPAIWALDAGAMALAKWDGQKWTLYQLGQRPLYYSWRLQSALLNGAPELVWLDRLADNAQVWRWDGVDGEMVAEVAGGFANDLIGDSSGFFGGGVIAAGTFIEAGGVPAASVAAFDGTEWSALGTGDVGYGAPAMRAVLYVGDEGGDALGRRVYVAADAAGGRPTRGVATWDGDLWASIGPQSDWLVSVQEFAFGDLGAGERLFAGGSIRLDGVSGGSVIGWDGQAWSVLADGMSDGNVGAMAFGAVEGEDPLLYVGGSFNVIDGVEYFSVAAIDADGWVQLGLGLPGQNGQVDRVDAMVIHDDGSGAALYAGGSLDSQPSSRQDAVVKWDSSDWSRVGDPLDSASADVLALCSADLGDGAKLYAGGRFDGLNDNLQNVAVWDGASWEPLGDGLPEMVLALSQIETEDGPRLAAAINEFTDGAPAERVYLWDGAAWSPFGAVAEGIVKGIAQASHEGGAVYLGGVFHEVAGVPSEGIARWSCEECAGDFDGNGVVDTRDFIAFLNAWALGDASADTDGNGVVDSRDVIAFLNGWNAAC